jgi:hypothetical protein
MSVNCLVSAGTVVPVYTLSGVAYPANSLIDV